MFKLPLTNFTLKPKFFLIMLLTAGLAIAFKLLNFQDLLQDILMWVKSLGYLAPIAFIVIYNLATVFFIPGSLLTLGGGALFGLFWGSIYVFVGATFGATFAFLIGRYVSRDWVAKKIASSPKFQALEEAVAKSGLKIVLLTRLSPLFPFNLLNYAFGVTQVSLKDYILGSVGMIPGTLMYVYIGFLVGDLATLGSKSQTLPQQTLIFQWILQGLGLIATIAVTIYVTKLAKTALSEAVEKNE